MFLVKKGKMTRLQLTSLLKNWVLLTNNSTVQISNLFLRLKTETKKLFDSLVSFHMPFLKMLYHWVKLKALTVRYYQSKWDIVCPTECAPPSMTDIKQKALRSRERWYNSVKERNVIAEETKGQNETRTWFDVRKPPIAASQCKRCLLKPTTSLTKAVSEVLFYTKQVQTKAMRDSIEYESSIIQIFENETSQKVR